MAIRKMDCTTLDVQASLGAMNARENIEALNAEILAAPNGAVLAVSDEPAGGSPTGTPTGAVLAVGAVSLG